MSNGSNIIKLSETQRHELEEMRKQYQATIGFDVSDPAVWFGTHLSSYITGLLLDLESEHVGSKTGTTRIQKQAAKIRRDTLIAFQNYFGRKPLAEDIIQELARVLTVPDYIAEAIRQDFQRLQG